MLNYLGVAGDRFRVEWVSAAEGARFAQVMNDFAEHIAALGENVKLRDLRCVINMCMQFFLALILNLFYQL